MGPNNGDDDDNDDGDDGGDGDGVYLKEVNLGQTSEKSKNQLEANVIWWLERTWRDDVKTWMKVCKVQE